MTFTKRNEVTEIQPADFDGIVAGRGCDFEIVEGGPYWARVGVAYRSFHSAIVRDMWFNAEMAEAVKARDDAKRQSLHAKLFSEIEGKE